ncbi:MAG: hypothetical protein ABI165_01665 [Bryobacteraceae bacterium]
MPQNLDALGTEIQKYMETHNFVVFHGASRLLDPFQLVFWDMDRFPEYKLFLKAAAVAEARIVVLHQRQFSTGLIDHALEQLRDAELDPAERRRFDLRLKKLRVYSGFTASLELSFDHQSRIYLFDLRAEWFTELQEILDEIESALPEDDDDDDEDDDAPLGGYFSQN